MILGQLYHFLNVRKSQERQASKKFYTKCSENSRSQMVFGTDIFRKFTLGAPEISAISIFISLKRKLRLLLTCQVELADLTLSFVVLSNTYLSGTIFDVCGRLCSSSVAQPFILHWTLFHVARKANWDSRDIILMPRCLL